MKEELGLTSEGALDIYGKRVKTQAVFEQLVFESADMPALPSPGFYNFPVRTGTSGAEGLGEYDSGTESLYSNKILLLLLLTVSQVCANTHFGYKVTNL